MNSANQPDPLHVKLFALHKQAKFGSYATCVNGNVTVEGSGAAITGSETSSQIEAWKELGDMSAELAKQEFLQRLFASAPYWKYEQFL